MRRAHKVDATQKSIVDALHHAGCVVTDISGAGNGVPDLLVCRMGVTYLIECKSARGTLTDAEIKWFKSWPGRAAVCYTPLDALVAVGAMAPEMVP
jgi:hypothetical protein